MEQSLPNDLSTIWQRVEEEVRSSLPPSTYELWLAPLRPLSAHGTTLVITGPKRLRTWVERRYGQRLEVALRNQTPCLRRIEFVAERSGEAEGATSPRNATSEPPLNPGHSFERFVIGNGNRIAHSAALAVAELPGEAYNPLFLHGPSGLGKTHLLGAIANYLRRNHPELTVRCTSGERFTSEFVTAMRGSGAQRFKERHRDIDVLLIDDVQFLEDKARTEEEFFHTFNALHETGSQIVLASDRPPQALSRLAERLRDRFEWGLCVEIAPPDLPTRLTVLSRLAGEAAIPIEGQRTLREIAARVPPNLRRLEGALTRVLAIASITGRSPSPELAREALEGRDPGLSPGFAPRRAAPSVELIQEAVCECFGLSREELLSPSRSPRITRARHLAMYVAREHSDSSLAEISRAFHRDHSTVLHALRRVRSQLEPGSSFHDSLNQVRSLLPRDEN